MFIKLRFDNFGWWDAKSKAKLAGLKADEPGWYVTSEPTLQSPMQCPYFVPDATTADEAVTAGLPREIADRGRVMTPAALLN